MGIGKISAMAHQLSGDYLFKGSTDGNQNIFEIPEYQRPYVWKRNNWEALFDDITDNDSGYFVGAIICAKKDSSSMDYTEYYVVDGQQRLTTLSIFLTAIYDAIRTRKNELKDKLTSDAFDEFWDERSAGFSQIKRSLTVKTSDGKFRTRVFPQNQDNIDDYSDILTESGLIAKDKIDCPFSIGKTDKRRLIPKAYEYFKNRISKYAVDRDKNNENLEQQLDRIMEILKKVNSAQLVMIEAQSHSSANTLFEALNNRGEPLTVTDLIKNKLFATMKERYPSDFKICTEEWEKEIWQKIFVSDGKEIPGSEQERFFRQSYNAFRSSWKAKFPVGKRTNLYESYETMIISDPKKTFEQIRESAQIYLKIQGKDQGKLSSGLFDAYKDLDRISGATSYTLLLYLVKNRNALQLAENNFTEVCRVLISFFVRRTLTGDPPTNKLDSIFIDYIGEIKRNNYAGKAVIGNLAVCLQKAYGSDEKFEEALRGDVYDARGMNSAIRFILVKVAEAYLGKQNPNFWQTVNKGSGKSVATLNWSIEHVLPQKLNPDWINMLADGDKSKADQIQEDNVHKLGNLTLTSYNSNLSNKSFSDKKTDPNFGYDNSILAKGLNSYICAQNIWGEKQIQERTDLLIKEILAIFAW